MLTYADVIAHKYPTYILTHIGDGTVYADLQWSIFNPTGPISQAQLDADIAAASGVTYAPLNLTEAQSLNLSAFAALPDSIGLVKKIADAEYALDTSTYLTGIDQSLVQAALGYVPYSSANPSLYTTKSYVDGLLTGVVYKNPVMSVNLIGDSGTPISSPAVGDTYIIGTGGTTGDWSTFSVDDVVQYQGSSWIKLGTASIGRRFGASLTSATAAIGSAAGKDNYLGEITGGSTGAWTWTWSAPAVNNAVFSNNSLAYLFGRSYTYTSDLVWIEFSGPGTIVDGPGLSYTGNTLNVNPGAGIGIVGDAVAVRLYPNGGLITTEDGTTTSASVSAALSLAKVGTAGSYKSTTVDAYGRVTGGSNPTTLAGIGITDALAASLLGTANGVAGLDSAAKLPLTQLPTHSHTWSSIASPPNTLNGYGIVDGQSLSPELTALAGLGTTGILVRDAAGSAVSRALQGTANQVVLTNGAGILGDPTIGLAAGLVLPGNVPTTMPSGTTAQRPTSPNNGMFWYNTTLSTVEFYQAGVWTTYGTAAVSGTGTVSQTLTGSIVAATGNTVIPYSSALPLITAGTQIWTQAITPKAITSRVGVSFPITVDANSNNRTIIVSLFRGNTCIATIVNEVDTSSHPKNMTMLFVDSPASTSVLTYSARVGIDSSSANWFVNSTSSGFTFGGSLTSNYRIDEIA